MFSALLTHLSYEPMVTESNGHLCPHKPRGPHPHLLHSSESQCQTWHQEKNSYCGFISILLLASCPVLFPKIKHTRILTLQQEYLIDCSNGDSKGGSSSWTTMVIIALLTQLLLIFSNSCGAEIFHVCSPPRGKELAPERVNRICFALCKCLQKSLL